MKVAVPTRVSHLNMESNFVGHVEVERFGRLPRIIPMEELVITEEFPTSYLTGDQAERSTPGRIVNDRGLRISHFENASIFTRSPL